MSGATTPDDVQGRARQAVAKMMVLHRDSLAGDATLSSPRTRGPPSAAAASASEGCDPAPRAGADVESIKAFIASIDVSRHVTVRAFLPRASSAPAADAGGVAEPPSGGGSGGGAAGSGAGEDYAVDWIAPLSDGRRVAVSVESRDGNEYALGSALASELRLATRGALDAEILDATRYRPRFAATPYPLAGAAADPRALATGVFEGLAGLHIESREEMMSHFVEGDIGDWSKVYLVRDGGERARESEGGR